MIAGLQPFFRNCSRRARLIAVLTKAVLVALYRVGRSVMRKQYDPDAEQRLVEEVTNVLMNN